MELVGGKAFTYNSAMKEVTIPLKLLKRLIDERLELDITGRAERIVLNRPGNSEPSAALAFAGLVHEAKPEARRETVPRYAELLRALDTQEGITEALERFLR